MRILTRYVLTELAKVFLVSLSGLTVLLIVGVLFREAAMNSLPMGQVVRLIPYIIPFVFSIAIPVTLLLAATNVYGRLAGSNEIVAAKALGISPTTLLWPAFVLAFFLSLLTVWLNDLAYSWGRTEAQRVLVEAVEEIAYNMLRAQNCYSSPQFSVNVKGVDGQLLLRPTVSVPARGKSPEMTITAEEAELHSDRQAGVLRLVLRDGSIHVEGAVRATFPDEYEHEIPLRDASRTKNSAGLPSWLSLAVIPGETAQQRRRIEATEEEMAARAAYQMIGGDFHALTSPEWNTRSKNLKQLWGRLYRLELEPHRRWSAGFTCLCFAWVGAPMAIRLRKSDFLTVFFLCFLPVLIVYYPLLIYGIDGAKNGTIPPQAVWAGNVLLLVWGAWLLRRVIRY